MFRYVVLGLLQDGEPRHGYALMKRYRDRVGEHVSTRNFYRELQRLVEEGLARNVDRAAESDARRAPYAITHAGRETFWQWFGDVTRTAMGGLNDDDISERLAFVADVPAQHVRTMLDRLQDDLWVHAKSLERSRDKAIATKAQADTNGFPVFGYILARRIRHVAVDVTFLTELREAYDAWVTATLANAAPPAAPNVSRDARRARDEPRKQRS